MKPRPDSLSRTAMIALIAGVLFAAFLAITPRLTAGTKTSEPVGPAAVPTTVAVEQVSVADPVVAVPEATALDGYDEPIVTDPEGTAEVPDPVADDEAWAAEWADVRLDGSLSMSMELIGPRDGKEVATLEDRDPITWHFRVSNTSGEELWGVYVYLETHGPVECDAHYLRPGDATDCWASDTAWFGAQTAEAWATAWTTVDEVGVQISYDYYVAD